MKEQILVVERDRMFVIPVNPGMIVQSENLAVDIRDVVSLSVHLHIKGKALQAFCTPGAANTNPVYRSPSANLISGSGFNFGLGSTSGLAYQDESQLLGGLGPNGSGTQGTRWVDHGTLFSVESANTNANVGASLSGLVNVNIQGGVALGTHLAWYMQNNDGTNVQVFVADLVYIMRRY